MLHIRVLPCHITFVSPSVLRSKMVSILLHKYDTIILGVQKEAGSLLDLLIIMLERVGIIIAVAFILTRFSFFKNLIQKDPLNQSQSIAAITFFGLFGVICTYFGTAINPSILDYNNVNVVLSSEEAIANSRVIAVVVAGLLGGYRIGIGAGLISGIHRMFLGGFTAFACGFSTIIAGVFSGYLHKRLKNIHPVAVFFIGAIAEAFQMGMILLLSKPFEKAFALVQLIGLPMIIANGVGTALFVIVLLNVFHAQEKAKAQQAQITLRIANQTLHHLRKGMNSHTATSVCNILYMELKPVAVALTDEKYILAHIGVGEDHHIAHEPIRTNETKEVIESGEMIVVKDGALDCSEANCSLNAAIIAPLTRFNETIGTLKLYYRSHKDITDSTVEIVNGLRSLLTTQLEIAETDKAYQLAKDAEIKALQAQVSPHFIFNALNIIRSLIRTNPVQARKLIHSLSLFLRYNVSRTEEFLITIEEELSHVRAYLEIMNARFVDKLTVNYHLDQVALQEKIPPFTLQTIVENALQHGIQNMNENCSIDITVKMDENDVSISIADNGVGMDDKLVQSLGKKQVTSKTGTGLGLYNMKRRVHMAFHEMADVQITSKKQIGTTVQVIIPRQRRWNAHA